MPGVLLGIGRRLRILGQVCMGGALRQSKCGNSGQRGSKSSFRQGLEGNLLALAPLLPLVISAVLSSQCCSCSYSCGLVVRFSNYSCSAGCFMNAAAVTVTWGRMSPGRLRFAASPLLILLVWFVFLVQSRLLQIAQLFASLLLSCCYWLHGFPGRDCEYCYHC